MVVCVCTPDVGIKLSLLTVLLWLHLWELSVVCFVYCVPLRNYVLASLCILKFSRFVHSISSGTLL